ncbi:MAG TPA: tRNA lysidine(34) synthetase TilS [Burkholderiales bacterium]|nr:tRNA lysidine(34) synthetase TilS [Burkholderiales bacterium]
MASSRKSSRSRRGTPADFDARVAARIKSIAKPADRLLVGFSGGVDSVVLLDSLARLRPSLRFRLAALHVNHQLSPNAGRWSTFCKAFCRERGVPFRSVKVRVARGDSTEAAARAARYAAYAREPADYIVLAQHQDDQAETVLLQLLRGAGVKGLAAMPPLRSRQSSAVSRQPSLSILRPLLDATRAEILEYAKARRLKWIEDESNADTYFLRNFLRHEVLPVIARRFPSYRGTLARSAQHLAEAARVLDEVAAADCAGQMGEGTLSVEALRRLPAARARNLLRYFLSCCGASMPGADRLDEALRQALTAKEDARVCVGVGDFELRRFEGRLHAVPKLAAPRPNYARRWRGEKNVPLPELGGVLTMDRARGAGVSVARLRGKPVTIRARRGGERLRPDVRRPRRSLKNLLQEARIPPWQRERLPLIFCGEDLVWAAGIGADCAYAPGADEAALRPGWRPSA